MPEHNPFIASLRQDVRKLGTSIRHRYDLPVVEAVPAIRRVAAGR